MTPRLWAGVVAASTVASAGISAALEAAQQPAARGAAAETRTRPAHPSQALMQRYCAGCHNTRTKAAGLALDGLDPAHVGASPQTWEAVLRKVRTGTMPPAGVPRPPAAELATFSTWLEGALDDAARAHPDPGRPVLHRLNRTEYRNAVRDLLSLELDIDAFLPPDDSSLGFDNIAEVLSTSPALLDRYMSAARQVSQLALGSTVPRLATYRTSKDLVPEARVNEDLPLGSRGGLAVRHYFPADGDYTLRIRLHRNAMDEIRGLLEPHQVDLRVDDRRIRLFTVGGDQPEAGKVGVAPVHAAISTYLIGADEAFEVTLPFTAGTHAVAATAVARRAKPEGPFQPPVTPRSADVFVGRHSGFGVGGLEIRGPVGAARPGPTPSRRRVLTCTPSPTLSETACARQILSTLARRAFRRPITPDETRDLLASFTLGRTGGDFDAGIALGLRRILMSPSFLFRLEQDPAHAAPGSPYPLDGLSLASRLSFFLWSSIPDDELLALGAKGALARPAVLEQQVRRMLADPKAGALIGNFAGQWLEIRNLSIVEPNQDVLPEFDETLRDAFARETQLFLESILREDRSLVDVLTADYTFVNERLARFYGIPNVYGERFRRVTWAGSAHPRTGILGHGSVLTVTSYATRTSPVLRGKWVLSNLIGAPPPPPPPDIPSLVEKSPDGRPLPVRQALESHRRSAQCATCHAPMDPLGFALEPFDPIGRWRETDETAAPIDASGVLPDGTRFQGLDGLRTVLLTRKEAVVTTVVEKLMTYALGRGVEHYDMPAVRAVVRAAAAHDYRWSSLVLGVARSLPFQMRRAGAETEPTVNSSR